MTIVKEFYDMDTKLTSRRVKMSPSLNQKDLDKEDDGNTSDHLPQLLCKAFCRTSSLARVSRDEEKENQHHLQLEQQQLHLSSQGITSQRDAAQDFSSPELVSVFDPSPSLFSHTLAQIGYDGTFRDSSPGTRSKNHLSQTLIEPAFSWDLIKESAFKTGQKKSSPPEAQSAKFSPSTS